MTPGRRGQMRRTPSPQGGKLPRRHHGSRLGDQGAIDGTQSAGYGMHRRATVSCGPGSSTMKKGVTGPFGVMLEAQ